MPSRENFCYDQADNFLFTIQLNSLPVEGTFIEFKPLSGPEIKYRVQDVVIELLETVFRPQGVPPPPDIIGWTSRVRIELDVTP